MQFSGGAAMITSSSAGQSCRPEPSCSPHILAGHSSFGPTLAHATCRLLTEPPRRCALQFVRQRCSSLLLHMPLSCSGMHAGRHLMAGAGGGGGGGGCEPLIACAASINSICCLVCFRDRDPAWFPCQGLKQHGSFVRPLQLLKLALPCAAGAGTAAYSSTGASSGDSSSGSSGMPSAPMSGEPSLCTSDQAATVQASEM